MIDFQNIFYPARVVELPNDGEVLISVTSLNDVLLKDDDHVFDEARYVDDQIFYFVEDSQINLDDEELITLLTKEVT
ncbi:hypothetical protein LRS05_02145 [Flavobacterium sp. J372]|uniref:hypothetical protein n=1 Tax=Flavobacterium sp. J372 TaxID=2898436 RepID=UPI0021510DEB|nr:hypothetical protein [Flavobacterium sp. J372]MCR5861017.1 hypothetical protein [Flavobacterium sp. J372]